MVTPCVRACKVCLLYTSGVLALFGYSINTLTLFAMVLEIGLLVDDAIVVVENVERIMSEEGLSPVSYTHLDVYKRQDQLPAGDHRPRLSPGPAV